MSLVIESTPGSVYRVVTPRGTYLGRTLENALRKAASAAGVAPASELQVNSVYEMAQVLETLIGPAQQGQIHEGIVSA